MLWLSEVIPLYATTLLLWVSIVLLLAPLDPAFALQPVTSVAASPVMMLFFGGFVLSVAGAKYGIDAYIAGWMVKLSGGRRRLLLLALMAGTAVLSMWMSNFAASAMMIATLRPLFSDHRGDAPFRTALMLGVAFAADFGGIATPIGTGPNLIAIGAVSEFRRITFLDWMLFGVPTAVLMLALTYVLLTMRYRVSGNLGIVPLPLRSLTRRGWAIVVIFAACVAAGMTEPLHGYPAALVGLAAAFVLFAAGLLDGRDLAKVPWDTLLLIAGGLTLGNLFERSGLASALAAAVNWNAMPNAVLMLSLVLACALISAVASNTAAAAVLIPIAMGIAPSPTVAVLVALGASMGVPFVISTPPNSMVYGEGGLRSRDFFIPGLVLMLAGCAAVAFAGPPLLKWLGL